MCLVNHPTWNTQTNLSLIVCSLLSLKDSNLPIYLALGSRWISFPRIQCFNNSTIRSIQLCSTAVSYGINKGINHTPKPNQQINKQTNKQTSKQTNQKTPALITFRKRRSIPPCFIPILFTTFFLLSSKNNLNETPRGWDIHQIFRSHRLLEISHGDGSRKSARRKADFGPLFRWNRRKVLSENSEKKTTCTPNGMVWRHLNSLIFFMFNKIVIFCCFTLDVFLLEEGFSPMNYVIGCVWRGLAPYPPCFLFKGAFLVDWKAD